MFSLYCLTSIAVIILIIICYSEYDTQEKFNNYSGLTNHSDAPWTIDTSTKNIVTDILTQIMTMVNKKTGMTYIVNSYDRLDQEKINKATTRFTADFFAAEIKTFITRRFIIIFTLNFNTKEVNVEHINLSNATKTSDKVFMDYPAPELILTDDNLLKNNYKIMGFNQSTLEYGILSDTHNNNKEIRKPNELSVGCLSGYQNPQALFPSRRQSRCWDTHGVNYIEKQTDLKIGVNNSPMKRMPQPYQNPTNGRKDWNSPTKWLFDLVDNSGGLGNSGSGGRINPR